MLLRAFRPSLYLSVLHCVGTSHDFPVFLCASEQALAHN